MLYVLLGLGVFGLVTSTVFAGIVLWAVPGYMRERGAALAQMRERMEEMNRQMQSFVEYVRTEMLARFQQNAPGGGAAIVPLRRPAVIRPAAPRKP